MMHIDSNKKLEQFLNNEFSNLRKKGEIIKPNSKYFNEIGSTTIEDIEYFKQLEIKLKALKNIFFEMDENIINSYEMIASPKLYEYRFKMDFVCSFNPLFEPNNRFGQRKKGNYNWVIDMDECNLIQYEWFKKIREVYD